MGLFDSISSAVGSISDAITPGIGALASGALGFLGQQSTNQSNQQNAADANAWSANQYATRYQTMTKDMEAAGLNPMLAYSQSPGAAPAAQMVQFQNPVSAATQAANSTLSTSAGASRDFSSAHQADAQVKMIDANVKKIEEETKNISQEGKRLFQATQQLAHQVNLTMAQEELTIAQKKQVAATLQKLSLETDLLKLDIKAAKDFDNLGREATQLRPIIEMIRPFLRISR